MCGISTTVLLMICSYLMRKIFLVVDFSVLSLFNSWFANLRCDRMVKHLTLPDSDIKKGLVKAEIVNAYENRLCSVRCRMNSYNRRKTSLAFEPTASTTLSKTESTTESTTLNTTFSTTEGITENNQETLDLREEAIASNATSTDEEILDYDLFSSNSTDKSYE